MGKRIQEFPLKSLSSKVVNLGYVGENEHTEIVIDCSEVLWDYPNAVVSAVVQPPVGDLYPVVVIRDEDNVIWTISASDVVYAGNGQIQLTFTNDGEIVKSAIGMTRISQSIETTGEAPTPMQNWMDEANAVLAEIEDMTVAASGLPAGSNPTATVSDVSGHKHIAFGIPQGAKGDPGDATIDDTAGVGDSTKVWSANKTATEVNSLSSALSECTGNEIIEGWVDGYYINLALSTTNISSPTPNASFRYVVVNCEAGDKFVINGTGGGAPRLWGFVDNSSPANVLEVADGIISGARDLVVTAPAGAKKIVINDSEKDTLCYKNVYLVSRVDNLLRWKDKKLVIFGDSRTYADGHKYGNNAKAAIADDYCVGFQQTIKKRLDCEIVSEGVSGNTSAQICARIMEYDFTGFDFALLEGGVNDFLKDEPIGELEPIGSTFDTSTVYGAWQSAVEYMLENYPDTQIYMTVPAICWVNGIVYPYDYAKVKDEVADLYNLPCVNLYNGTGINSINRETYYCDDITKTGYYVHFNDYGNALIGELLSAFLATGDSDDFRIKKNGNTLIIAGANSAFKKYADIVCTGANDQILINEAIANKDNLTFYFTDDSEFSINNEIVLKDGISIKSNGAKFICADQTVYNFNNSTTTTEDNKLNLNLTETDISGLVVGQWVEIRYRYGTAWVQGRLTYVNYDGRNIQVDVGKTMSVSPGTIRNVSSCFVATNLSGVKISGIVVDWNKENNPIAENTGFEQNGILLKESNNCIVENCKLFNGGRRGILTWDSTNITIQNCDCYGWDEHGIDIYDSNSYSDSSIISGVLVDSCRCYENAMAGIQLHGGSWVTVTNCICYDNEEYGIGAAEYAKHNIISQNIVYDNDTVGILLRTGSHNNTICGNTVRNNVKGIYILGVSGSFSCDNNVIANNDIEANSEYGIFCVYSNGEIVKNNKITKNTTDPLSTRSVQFSFSSYNDIQENYVECYSQTAEAGIRVAGGDSDYSNISNNTTINGANPTYTGTHVNVVNNFAYNK